MEAVIFGGKRICGVPAEALPLLDEMLGAYMLCLLARHGVRQATLVDFSGAVCGTLPAPQQRRCVRAELADRLAPGPTLFINGPMLTDCDLSALQAAHNAGKARVAAVCRLRPRAGDTIVQTDAAGVITHARLAGADEPEAPVVLGMMVMDASAYARMGEEAVRLPGAYAQAVHCYWRAVCTIADYAAAQQDLLMGRVGLPVGGRRSGLALLAPMAVVDPQAHIAGRCYIGSGARIGPQAWIGEGAVIGRGVSVGRGARIEHSCIWQYGNVLQGQVVRHLLVIPQIGNRFLAQILPYSGGKNA